MPRNKKQANLVFRLEVASGHLAAVVAMLEKGEALDKVLHQICAVQAALDKIKANIQNRLLEESISAMRANPCDEVSDSEVNKLIGLYTRFQNKRQS